MRTRLFAVCAAVAILAVVGGVWAYAKGKAESQSCCYPGSECCYPGSPCCEEGCCAAGASCCPDGPCCASAKAPCAAKSGTCCDLCPACCENCTEEQCCEECILCCLSLGCDASCCFRGTASAGAPVKKTKTCCSKGCCK